MINKWIEAGPASGKIVSLAIADHDDLVHVVTRDDNQDNAYGVATVRVFGGGGFEISRTSGVRHATQANATMAMSDLLS